jgi:nitrate reductase gamma subunit
MSQSPESSKTTTASSAIFVVLALVSVALRFYTRTQVKASIAADDWWILVGLVLTCITGGLLLYGMLIPTAPLPAENLRLTASRRQV